MPNQLMRIIKNRELIAAYVKEMGEKKFVSEINGLLEDKPLIKIVASDPMLKDNLLFAINLAILFFINKNANESSGKPKSKLFDLETLKKLEDENLLYEFHST